jgi:hypothetical protein
MIWIALVVLLLVLVALPSLAEARRPPIDARRRRKASGDVE